MNDLFGDAMANKACFLMAGRKRAAGSMRELVRSDSTRVDARSMGPGLVSRLRVGSGCTRVGARVCPGPRKLQSPCFILFLHHPGGGACS